MQLTKFFFPNDDVKMHVKEAIALKGIKQKWIAEQLEISEAHLSRMLGGHQNLGEKRLVKIAKLLDVSQSSLYVTKK